MGVKRQNLQPEPIKFDTKIFVFQIPWIVVFNSVTFTAKLNVTQDNNLLKVMQTKSTAAQNLMPYTGIRNILSQNMPWPHYPWSKQQSIVYSRTIRFYHFNSLTTAITVRISGFLGEDNTLYNAVLHVMTLCSLVYGCHCFQGIKCVHPQNNSQDPTFIQSGATEKGDGRIW